MNKNISTNFSLVLHWPRQVYLEGDVVVEVREGDAVLGTNRLSNDDLVDVIELIPVLIPASCDRTRHSFRITWHLSFNIQSQALHYSNCWLTATSMNAINNNRYLPGRLKIDLLSFFVFDEWLELWPSWYGQIESLSRKERLQIKKIEVVLVDEVCNKLIGEAIERGHLR